MPRTKPKPRGYSRDFQFTDDSKRYLLDGIPPALWKAVRAKCQRDGVSVRAQILTLLQEWSGQR